MPAGGRGGLGLALIAVPPEDVQHGILQRGTRQRGLVPQQLLQLLGAFVIIEVGLLQNRETKFIDFLGDHDVARTDTVNQHSVMKGGCW